MRKALAVCALAPLLLTSGARAERLEPGFETFKGKVMALQRGTFAGEWFAMMPSIASDCTMKLSKAQMQNVAVRFPDQSQLYVAKRMLEGYPNPFKESWDVMYRDKPDGACGIADKLWGEDGDMFPGLLLKP